MADIREIRGNLFDSLCQTLVNAVNCNGVMGKGIAFEFRHRFPEMFAAYADLCARGRLRPGLLQLWTRQEPWVLNFPTKDDWRRPSEPAFIEAGLRKFAASYAGKGITSVAFPRLGTANGGVGWAEVRALMHKVLGPLPGIEIEVYEYDPSSRDRLFDRLRARVSRFDVADWRAHLGVNRKQAERLRDAIAAGNATRMTDLETIKGIGEITFDRIFAFARSEGRPVATRNELQPRLF